MHKSIRRNGHAANKIYHDIEKIKSALADTSYDVKNKAEELLLESLDNLKEKSMLAKENVASFTSEKPFRTIGISLFVGTLIGYFLRK